MILQGDAREVLETLPDASVHCVITSPPYLWAREYGTAQWQGGDPDCDHRKDELRKGVNLAQSAAATRGGAKKIAEVGWTYRRGACRCGAIRVDQQIGQEKTPDQYIENLVEVFRQVKRVLHPTGTAWVVMGDTFAQTSYKPWGLRKKDLMMVPHRLAMALQMDGWYVRSDIVYAKPNPMPESVGDRPTRAHEYVFLLAKSRYYYYDAAAIRESPKDSSFARINQKTFQQQTGGNKDYGSGTNNNRSVRRTLVRFADKQRGHSRKHEGFNDRWDLMTREEQQELGANKRDVWTIAPQTYRGAHFAVMPEKLVELCVLAGSSERGCCAQCGAPWKRVSEKKRVPRGDAFGKKEDMGPHDHGQAGSSYMQVVGEKTMGWKPTCIHHSEVVPCTILDPFAGTATSLAVALRHGRNALGIELNPSYIELAKERLAKVQASLPGMETA